VILSQLSAHCLSQQRNESSTLPLAQTCFVCKYYDPVSDEWKTDGVETVSVNFDTGSVRCAATHLTAFSVVKEQSGIKVNTVTEEEVLLTVTFTELCSVDLYTYISDRSRSLLGR
jgi:hypothetical protein